MPDRIQMLPDVPDGRYVFFKSLLEEFEHRTQQFSAMARRAGWMGQDYLTKQTTHGDSNFDEINANIQKVLINLKKIADIEYTKEKAYIEAQKKRLNGSIFKINFPDRPDKDWAEFITLLNFARGNASTFFNEVKKEYARLDENKKYFDDINKKIKNKELTSQKEIDRARQGYKRTDQYRITEYLVSLVKQMFGGGNSNKNSYANIIKDYIVRLRWNAFLRVENGRFSFDEKEFGSLIFAFVQMIIEKIVKNTDLKMAEIFGNSNDYNSRMASFTTWMDEKGGKEIVDMNKIEGILNSPFARKMISTNFQRKMIMEEQAPINDVGWEKKKNTARSRHARKVASNVKIDKQKISNEKETRKEIGKMLSSGQWLKVSSKLYQPSGSWLVTEAKELLQIRNGELSVSLGSSSVKTDNAFIQVDFDIDESFFSQVEKLVQTAYEENYSSLPNSLKYFEGDVSTADWKERQKKFEALRQTLSQILKEEKNIQNLSSSFIIESSDKIYESYGTKAKAFKGGDFGSDLTSQLAKIDLLANTGGFTIGDLNWLTNAIINSHPSTVIGTGMKASLENYLSMVAAALLFDDSVEIMAQSTQSLESSVSSTSINVIHLFYLQGFGYYPLSQILYSIYNKIKTAYDECAPIAAKGGGVKVKIKFKNYPADQTPYENLNMQTWVDTGAQAEAGALLQMTVLGSFMGALKSLIPFSE